MNEESRPMSRVWWHLFIFSTAPILYCTHKNQPIHQRTGITNEPVVPTNRYCITNEPVSQTNRCDDRRNVVDGCVMRSPPPPSILLFVSSWHIWCPLENGSYWYHNPSMRVEGRVEQNVTGSKTTVSIYSHGIVEIVMQGRLYRVSSVLCYVLT